MRNKIVYCILSIVYAITYNFKIKQNKITFISYESKTLEKDFKLLSKELEALNKYEIVYVLTKFENTLIWKIKYLFNCMKQVYHMNTSKVVLLDYNNFPISSFKKKGVTVFQIWHASGAIKKFGNDIERNYKVKNYDYVLATSDVWKEPFSTAFNVKEDNVLPLGIPKTDKLFSKKKVEQYRNDIIKKYPEIKGKKVVLFAPTFRGSALNTLRYEEINLKYIKEKLGEDYVIMYKLHPWYGDKVICTEKGVIDGNKESLYRLLAVADYFISDYSAIIFDYSILEKSMIFYTPDIEQYRNERGLYIDYEKEMPGPVCKNEDQVIEAILKDDFDIEKVKAFKNKYFKYTDGKSTKRVVDFIEKLL